MHTIADLALELRQLHRHRTDLDRAAADARSEGDDHVLRDAVVALARCEDMIGGVEHLLSHMTPTTPAECLVLLALATDRARHHAELDVVPTLAEREAVARLLGHALPALAAGLGLALADVVPDAYLPPGAVPAVPGGPAAL